MTEFVPISVIAEAAGKSRRTLEIAAGRIIEGKALTWNGARLIVRRVFGRGGKAGFQYEISIDSLPIDIQDRLKRRLTAAKAPSHGGAARLERDVWHHIISRIVIHPKGTEARAAAAKAEAKREILNPRTGQFECYSLSTIMRRVKLFEQEGEARLGRQRRSDAGEKRVILSNLWDKSVPFDDATKERIAQDLRSYIRGQHKNLAAFGHVQLMAERKLHELTHAAGFEPSPGLCAVPENFIKSEKVARKAGVFLRDRKKSQDDLPGVLRGIDGIAPCDIVYGDVHSVDIILEKID